MTLHRLFNSFAMKGATGQPVPMHCCSARGRRKNESLFAGFHPRRRFWICGRLVLNMWQRFGSCSDTPQQNGLILRKNRHLLEIARSLMFSIKIPKYT